MSRQHRRPRLSAFELLPEHLRGVVQSAIDRVVERCASQTEVYADLVDELQKAGVEKKDIPAASSFNRLILREGPNAFTVPPLPGGHVSGYISGNSLRLLADALRSIANDLDRPIDDEAPSC